MMDIGPIIGLQYQIIDKQKIQKYKNICFYKDLKFIIILRYNRYINLHFYSKGKFY